MSITANYRSDAAVDYRTGAARIFDGEHRKTYGDFRAWLQLAFKNAVGHGEKELIFSHNAISRLFGVCRETVIAWCAKARDDGLLKWRVRRIQDAKDGTWRRITNAYTVALTVTLRRIWRAAIAGLCAGTASPPTRPSDRSSTPAKPTICAIPPYVEFSPQHHSAKSDNLPVSPELATGSRTDTTPRRSWACRVCQTPNSIHVDRCHSCKKERPFIATETTAP